jgi:hypothetical protein
MEAIVGVDSDNHCNSADNQPLRRPGEVERLLR